MDSLPILIPARGGSKRIPNKNLVDLSGKPLLSYVIETCRHITDEIYVSTEDIDIQIHALSMDVTVIERPENLAQDDSKTEDVVLHFLEEIDEVDLFCVVQPTSPFLNFNSILDGIGLIDGDGLFDSIVSVCRETNYYWDINGKPINFELGNRKRTQGHDIWFRENGAFYMTRKDDFLEDNILQNGLVGYVEMNARDSIDIDTQEDLEFAEIIMNGINL